MNIENIWTGVNEADNCQPCDTPSHTFFSFAKDGNMIILACRICHKHKMLSISVRMTVPNMGMSTSHTPWAQNN